MTAMVYGSGKGSNVLDDTKKRKKKRCSTKENLQYCRKKFVVITN